MGGPSILGKAFSSREANSWDHKANKQAKQTIPRKRRPNLIPQGDPDFWMDDGNTHFRRLITWQEREQRFQEGDYGKLL